MADQITLSSLLKELSNISGFRISIHDTQFHEIAAYPEHPGCFCQFIQRNGKAKEICISNDKQAFSKVEQDQQVYLYQCKFGLYEAVAPLYSFGTLTGYLMMGQIIDNNEHIRTTIFNNALSFTKDSVKLKEVIDQIPISSKDKILSSLTIMDVCAKYITLSNRMNLATQNIAHDIKKYIDQNYSSRITIDRICSNFYCSRGTCTRHFKEKYGLSINEYITKTRLLHACNLLINTNNTINEISSLCGFSDQNYFCKAFSKGKDMTPRQFRQQNKL